MTFAKENWKNIQRGLDGEGIVRDFFKKHNIPFMQVDVMFFSNKKDRWFLGEIKTQEMFERPPFDGHGLPRWQINMRMEFYKRTKIEPWLFVVDYKNGFIFYNSLIELEKTKFFDTNGKSPRRIYNLIYFRKIKLEKDNEDNQAENNKNVDTGITLEEFIKNEGF